MLANPGTIKHLFVSHQDCEVVGTDEGYNYFKLCLTVSQIMGFYPNFSNLIDKPDFRMISNTMTLINLQHSWFLIHMLRLYFFY